MHSIYYITIGFLLALVAILTLRKLKPNNDYKFWRVGLIIAAAIYVGFVIVGGAMQQMPMELAGVVLYGAMAWLSKKYTLHWLALGWALHICWDVFLHSQNSTPYVPEGYPGLCMGFDIVIAGYILYLIRERAGIRVEQNG